MTFKTTSIKPKIDKNEALKIAKGLLNSSTRTKSIPKSIYIAYGLITENSLTINAISKDELDANPVLKEKGSITDIPAWIITFKGLLPDDYKPPKIEGKQPIDISNTVIDAMTGKMLFSFGLGKQSQEVTSSKPIEQEVNKSEAIYASELKNITNIERIIMGDNKPDQSGGIPKNQKAVSSEVLSWLQQAKIYKGEILKPKNVPEGKVLTFNAYIGPCILDISTSNNHKITIKPASYIDTDDGNLYSVRYTNNVLEFVYDGQKTYIESSQLFDWIKSNKWEKEFKSF